MTSRAAGWPSDAPTAAQLKDFFVQIESGRVTKDRLQTFLRERAAPSLHVTDFPIEALGFHRGPGYEHETRTLNCLKRCEIDTIADLTGRTPDDLLRIVPNFGKKSLELVQQKLAAHGLALRGEEPPTEPTKEVRRPGVFEQKILELAILQNHRVELMWKILHNEREMAVLDLKIDLGLHNRDVHNQTYDPRLVLQEKRKLDERNTELMNRWRETCARHEQFIYELGEYFEG